MSRATPVSNPQGPDLRPKALPRQGRAQETYERLLGVAADLLGEVGIERLSTNLICDRAGLTPPAFYRYFPNKYALLHAMGWTPTLPAQTAAATLDPSLVVGGVATALALALFICTAMIYACLRFLAEWHTPLTPLNYTLLGAASGFTLAAAYAATAAPGLVGFLSGWAIVLTLAGAAGRVASLWRNARLKPRSTLQTAIGVKHPQVVQRSQGFMGGSFNTREFFHGASASFMRAIKPAFLVLAFVLPVALLALGRGEPSAGVLALAFVVQYLGLLAERWFFFAQANHPQNLYYQAVS